MEHIQTRSPLVDASFTAIPFCIFVFSSCLTAVFRPCHRQKPCSTRTGPPKESENFSSKSRASLIKLMALGERCDACGSTTTLSDISPAIVPRIELESFDMIPFSESFSGLFENENDDDDDERNDINGDEPQTNRNDMSYDVEQYSDIQDLYPEWDDDDVAEIMVLSPKPQQYSTLPTISEENDVLSLASNEAYCSQPLPSGEHAVTLADFDTIPTAAYPMLCRKRSSNNVYVIKAINPGSHTEESILESVRVLRASFVEQLCWRFPGVGDDEEGRVYLVSESHSSESLATLVKSSGPVACAGALYYACEVVDGLSSLHAANIIHRDVSPFNVFVDNAGHLVLTNFCNAAKIGDDAYGMPSSAALEYQAPEILLGWAHDSAVDCWSFGALLHFLLTGSNPMEADNYEAIRGNVLNGNIIFSDLLPTEAKHLIQKCLERNPTLRLTIEGIRDHNYFAAVDWRDVRQKNIPPPARSRTPSPKLRPTSHDFPLPPARFSLGLDPSLDISFTLHTASKAVPSQPRLERIPSRGRANVLHRPLFRASHSMEDLRSRRQALKRLSLPLKSNSSTPLLLLRDRRSVQDSGASPPAEADVPVPDSVRSLHSRLSLQIQTPDLLPRIFRSTLLDERVIEEEEPPQPSSAITSPTICEMTPRERMAQFWETLDVESQDSASTVPSLELRDALRLALPCPPLPVSRRLRKRVSTSAVRAPDQRFSIISATHTTTKLRKLRRPLSTPGLVSRRPDPILNLPPGVEQIGRGIGFTYKMPVGSHSKASICTNPARSAAGKLFRGGLGLKNVLRRAKSQQFSPPGSAGRRRGPPANILTSPRLTGTAAPGLHSPVSDGPLTPDSLTFPPLPEIASDPFAKDEVEDVRSVGKTLRLVHVPPSDYRLPFPPNAQPLDNMAFSSWNT
ncbi:kinase-like domain-containing protein [Mycena sanguinolenta]|nr:kinase-like domain-containing protein [Mycena sanguinolenta]